MIRETAFIFDLNGTERYAFALFTDLISPPLSVISCRQAVIFKSISTSERDCFFSDTFNCIFRAHI